MKRTHGEMDAARSSASVQRGTAAKVREAKRATAPPTRNKERWSSADAIRTKKRRWKERRARVDAAARAQSAASDAEAQKMRAGLQMEHEEAAAQTARAKQRAWRPQRAMPEAAA
eukprot:2738218-Pleurochrysis_carterae.AAC.1